MDWKKTYIEHFENIKLRGVWGTQVELQATSDFFGVMVFVVVWNTRETYCWHVLKPCTMKVPECNDKLSLPIYPYTMKHIELAQNSTRNHYNSKDEGFQTNFYTRFINSDFTQDS